MGAEIAGVARRTRAIARQPFAVKNLGDIVCHRVQYGICGQKNKNKPAAISGLDSRFCHSTSLSGVSEAGRWQRWCLRGVVA